MVLKGCLVSVCSHGTRGNTLIRFIRGIGDGYLRIQCSGYKGMPNVLVVWGLYQMYRRGTGTSHGLLRDTVSDLIIKGEHLGQF